MKKPYCCFCKHVKTYKRHYIYGLFGSFAIVNMILLFVGFFGTLYHTQYHASAAGPSYINPNDCNTVSQITTSECKSLVNIYNATDGQNWTNYNNRGNVSNPCSWFGVTCGLAGGNIHVVDLMLENNNLVGILPASIQDLSYLQGLYLGYNTLGNPPLEIGSLDSLVQLYLNNNIITKLPTEIGNLGRLLVFDASYNQIENISPLYPLAAIENINLKHNLIPLIDKTYVLLSDTLVYLDLSYNLLTDFSVIPDSWSDVLTHLYLEHNQINKVPSTMSQLKKLSYLNLSKNFIDDIKNIPAANTLTHLYLSHNKILNIPATFSDFQKPNILVDLNISYNLLTKVDYIPDLSSLVILNLSNNRIGTMFALDKLKVLEVLNMGFNRLKGDFAFIVEHMTTIKNSLREFSFRHNYFDKTVPINLPNIYLVDNGKCQIDFNMLDVEADEVIDPTLISYLNTKCRETAYTQSYLNTDRTYQYRDIETTITPTLVTAGTIYGGDIITVNIKYGNNGLKPTSDLDLSIYNDPAFTLQSPSGGFAMKKDGTFDTSDPCLINLADNTAGIYFDALNLRATDNGRLSFFDYLNTTDRDYDGYYLSPTYYYTPYSTLRGKTFIEWMITYQYDSFDNFGGSFPSGMNTRLFDRDVRDYAIDGCGIGGNMVTSFNETSLAKSTSNNINFNLQIADGFSGDFVFTGLLESDNRLYREQITSDNINSIIIHVNPKIDTDGDGITDNIDNCISVPNSGQEDSNYYITGAGKMNFIRPDGIGVDRNLAENQDRITDNVWLTRKNTQGLFNIASEAGYNGSVSPANTEWAYGTCADTNPTLFDTWEKTNGASPPNMIGQDMCLHLITDDLYYDIMFTDWAVGGMGGQGGFSYTRTEFVRGDACDCNDKICTSGTDYTGNLICTPYDYICPVPDTDNDGITDNIDNCPLVANPLQEVSTGGIVPTFVFTKSDYVNFRLWENQDCITSDVCITRKNTRGIYNIISEYGYLSTSPADTEWAYGTCADTGILTFTTWVNANGNNPPSMIGQDMCLHLITDDLYYDINFGSRSSNNAGGGFSYKRSRPLGVACDCTDSICTTGTDYTGNLICNPDPACPVPVCGDNNIDPGEQCDTVNLSGYTCGNFGYSSGTLNCTTCTFDTGACFTPPPPPTCGDGNIDPGEQCDGSNFGVQTCGNFGYDSGTLNCMSCTTDTSNCFNVPITPVAVCGNSIIETGEVCDGSAPFTQTCGDFGYSLGTLSCNGCIAFNTGACSNPPPIVPPNATPPSGGGGGGGGGLTIDPCPNGDYSTGYYDHTCGTPPTTTSSTHITTTPPVVVNERAITRLELAQLVVPFVLSNLDLPVYSTEKCVFSDINTLSKNNQSIIKTSCRLRLMGREPNGLDIKPIYVPDTIVTNNEFVTVYSRIINDGRYNIMSRFSLTPWYGNHLAALKKAGIVSSPVTITKSYVQSMLTKIQQNPEIVKRSDINIGHAIAATPVVQPTIKTGSTIKIGTVATTSTTTSLSVSLRNLLLDLSRFFGSSMPILSTGSVTTGAIISGQVHGSATTEPTSDMTIKYISPKTLLNDLARFF